MIFGSLGVVRFWQHHPALFYGVALLLGFYGCFQGIFSVIIPGLSLWLPFGIAAATIGGKTLWKPFLLSLGVFATAWSTATLSLVFPVIPERGVRGKAHIEIDSVALQHFPFGSRWSYRCRLKDFWQGDRPLPLAALPCLVTRPAADPHRPLAHHDYWIEATLIQTPQGQYRLKTQAHSLWSAIPHTHSWAESRYAWKQRVRQWINRQFRQPLTASFLAGLLTGEFDDYWMRGHFSRFGLQHLLAISGFHFSIIAAFLNGALSLFLPRRLQLLALLLMLAAYAFFLGPQPSILRAWIMCTLAIAGQLLHKHPNGLNSLGVALLAVLAYDPLLTQDLGFQLSFAATAAILLFYQPALAWLCCLWPQRKLSEVIKMDLWQQHGYCLLSFLRQGLALSLAVNAAALPLTLYYFHQFPWMGFLYNLFFPFLSAAALGLLLLGAGCGVIPFLAQPIHLLNELYTSFLLSLIHQIPPEIDHYLVVAPFAPVWLVGYFCLMSLIGMAWQERAAHDPPLFAFL